MSDVSVTLCTCAPDQAKELAEKLVAERLAACVNVLPNITSTYRWQGDVVTEDETLLIIKGRTDRFEALRERLVELHGYSVPEVVRLDAAAGHLPYLNWVVENA